MIVAAELLLLAVALGAAPKADADTRDAADGGNKSTDRVRLQFSLGGVGYQGGVANQRFREPQDARIDVARHGVELLGGGASASTQRKGGFSLFHSEVGRAGVFLGSTPQPDLNGSAAAADKTEPRNGFNFGIFSVSRFNAGAAYGGVCGFGASGIGGLALKAYTRSTEPGNHLIVDAGLAAGLHCHSDRSFFLLQWGFEGHLGVEQMQDLAYQQGNDAYSPSQGNGLVLFPEHGPRVTLVHDGDRINAALTGEGIWSVGRGRYGGRRRGARLELALTRSSKTTGFGISPWYQFDWIDYTGASKVEDLNVRRAHTFGMSLVYSRPFGKASSDGKKGKD